MGWIGNGVREKMWFECGVLAGAGDDDDDDDDDACWCWNDILIVGEGIHWLIYLSAASFWSTIQPAS